MFSSSASKSLAEHIALENVGLDVDTLTHTIESWGFKSSSNIPKKKKERTDVPDSSIKDDKTSCKHVITRGTLRKGDMCNKPGSYEHEGKWYCGTKNGTTFKGHIRTAQIISEKKLKVEQSKKKTPSSDIPQVLQNIIDKKITFRKNDEDRYWDPISRLVVNRDTKEVYGYQNENGDIESLTDSHIRICEANGWKFRVEDDEIGSEDDE